MTLEALFRTIATTHHMVNRTLELHHEIKRQGINTRCSLLMISLGIIGEYLARIYEEVKGRPRYIVTESIDLADGKTRLLPPGKRSARPANPD